MGTLQILGMARAFLSSSTNPISRLLSNPEQRHSGLNSRTDLTPTQHVLVGVGSVDPMVKKERQSTMLYITLEQSEFDGSGVGDITGDCVGDITGDCVGDITGGCNDDTNSTAFDNDSNSAIDTRTNDCFIFLGFTFE